MSSVASPDAGGDSPIKQSGTAPAVIEPPTYPTSASFRGNPIAQIATRGNEHNGNDGGADPETVLDGAFTDASKDHFSAQEGSVPSSISPASNIKNAAYGSGEPGSGLRMEKVKAVDLAFPTIGPGHDDDNTAVQINDNGNCLHALDQTTIGIPTSPMVSAYPTKDTKSSPNHS